MLKRLRGETTLVYLYLKSISSHVYKISHVRSIFIETLITFILFFINLLHLLTEWMYGVAACGCGWSHRRGTTVAATRC